MATPRISEALLQNKWLQTFSKTYIVRSACAERMFLCVYGCNTVVQSNFNHISYLNAVNIQCIRAYK
jgi:hypothetical protein